MIRHAILSAASIVLAACAWLASPYLFDRMGLGDFDPLDRICLVILLLSAVERVSARMPRH